jgi:hypothetical protein
MTGRVYEVRDQPGIGAAARRDWRRQPPVHNCVEPQTEIATWPTASESARFAVRRRNPGRQLSAVGTRPPLAERPGTRLSAHEAGPARAGHCNHDDRATRKAPLLRGQPGYRSPLDRDGDGRACE